MRSTFKVLFYLKKNAPKKNGSVPVMCRITIDGTIAQFSCKCDIHPDLWNIKSNRASGKSTVALETNRFLDKIRVGINAKYKEIAERDNYVTAEKVKNAFLGLEMRHETLLKVFAQHNEDFFKQVVRRLPHAQLAFDTIPKAYIGQSKRHDALGKMDKPPEFRWAISDTDDIRRLMPGVEIIEEAGLSSVCKPRYPWLLRLVYATAWGRRKLDMRLMRIQVPSS